MGRDTLHVLLIDKSRRSERVSLRLPASGRADVQRLLAPSAAARSGVTLGGRALGADGRWQGMPTPPDGRAPWRRLHGDACAA